jgi:hypothetical protein
VKNVLLYTVHKAASMFLHRLTDEVAQELEIDYYSINDDKHYETIRQESWKTFIEDEDRTGCFGPIRAGTADPTIPQRLEAYSIVLHLRDPRDVLTSLYFSHTYSHAREPGKFHPSEQQRQQWEGAGIDEFVLDRAPKIHQRYQQLCSGLLGRDNVRFVKYEQLIAAYDEWLKTFLSAFAHVPLPSKRMLGIIGGTNSWPKLEKRLYEKHQHEFTVSSENVHAHKRQVVPGDHRRKLAPETIVQLNQQFGEILSLLQYDA